LLDLYENMQQAYCLTCFLAAKEAHTFDLRFRQGRHAASVCLRFSLEDWFGPGVRVCDDDDDVAVVVVVESADESEVVVVVGDDDDDKEDDKEDDNEDDNEDPCED
jgi:hypothetical protein